MNNTSIASVSALDTSIMTSEAEDIYISVFETESSALKKIFSFYASPPPMSSAFVSGTPGDTASNTSREHAKRHKCLTWKAVIRLIRDFRLCPDLVSRQFSHAAFKATLNSHQDSVLASPSDLVGGDGGIGLSYTQFLSFLASIVGETRWSSGGTATPSDALRRRRGKALLQWLDGSGGKDKINAIRGTAVVPRFGLDGLGDDEELS